MTSREQRTQQRDRKMSLENWKKEMNRCNQNRKYFHPSCASSEHLHVPQCSHEEVGGNTCLSDENEIQQTVTEITSTIDRLWKWRKNGTQKENDRVNQKG